MNEKARIECLVLMASMLCISGCATSPIPRDSADSVPKDRVHDLALTEASPSKVQVTITRDRGMMGVACPVHLYLDGSIVASLRAKERVTLYLEPGEHIAGARSPGGICGGGTSQTDFVATTGKQIGLRIAWGQSGDLKIERSAF
jgi:hypothetical protein